jgi:hypothetical protein
MKINLFNYIITIKKKKRKYVKRALDAPVAPNGYVHRWIREELIKGSNRQGLNYNNIKTGYSLVKANKYRNSFPVIEKGRFKGYIGLGGLILARISDYRFSVNEKKEYYDRSN